MASGQREVRSMMVRRWVCWAEVRGKGVLLDPHGCEKNVDEGLGCVEEEGGCGGEF